MKYLKRFNHIKESKTDDIQIVKDFMDKNYTTQWFDEELSNRCYDYVDKYQAEEYDGDYETAYTEYCNGGAIEYDLLKDMRHDIEKLETSLSSDEIMDLTEQHMKDNCEWYDRLVFDDDKDGYNNLFDDIKNYDDLFESFDFDDLSTWDKIDLEFHLNSISHEIDEYKGSDDGLIKLLDERDKFMNELMSRIRQERK